MPATQPSCEDTKLAACGSFSPPTFPARAREAPDPVTRSHGAVPGPHAGHQSMKAAAAGLIAENGPAYEPGESVRMPRAATRLGRRGAAVQGRRCVSYGQEAGAGLRPWRPRSPPPRRPRTARPGPRTGDVAVGCG